MIHNVFSVVMKCALGIYIYLFYKTYSDVILKDTFRCANLYTI